MLVNLESVTSLTSKTNISAAWDTEVWLILLTYRSATPSNPVPVILIYHLLLVVSYSADIFVTSGTESEYFQLHTVS